MALNVGNLSFNITGNTNGLQKAVDKLNEFSRVVNKVAQTQQEGASGVIKAYAAQERAIKSALNATLNMQQKIRAASGPSELLARTTNAFKGLSSTLTNGKASVLDYSRAQDKFRLIMGQVSRELKSFQEAQNAAGQGKLANFLKNLQSSAILAAGPLSGISSRISAISGVAERSSVSMAVFLASASAAVIGLGFLSKSAIEATMEMQKIQNVMQVSAGSTTAAGLEFKYVHDEALKLGLSIDGLAMNYANLSAATKGTSLAGEKTRSIFDAVATASSALRMSTEDVNGVMLAFTQMVSMGKVRSQELVTQLSQHIPGTMQLAAQSMGKTTAELRKMMEAGTLLTSDFLPKFAEQLQKTFGTSAAQQAASLSGAINNLKTNVFDFLTTFDQTVGVSESFRTVVDATSNSLKYMTTHMNSILGLLGALTGAMTAFMLIMKWDAIVAGWKAIRTAIIAYTAAARTAAITTAGLEAVLTGGLSLLLQAGVIAAGAAAGYALMAPSADDAAESTDRLIKSTQELTKNALSATTFAQQADEIKNQITQIQSKMDELKRDMSTGLGKSLDNWGFTNKAKDIATYQEQVNKLQGALKELNDKQQTFAEIKDPLPENEKAAKALAQAMQVLNELQAEANSLASGESAAVAEQNKQVAKMSENLKQATVAQAQINTVTAQYAALLKQVAQLKAVHEVDTQINNLQAQYNSLLVNTSEAESKRAKDIEKIRQALSAAGNTQETVNQKTAQYADALQKVAQQTALNDAAETMQKLQKETALYSAGFDSNMVSMQQEVDKFAKALKDAGVDNDTVATKTAAYTAALQANKKALAEVTAANKAIDDTFDSITEALTDVASNTKTVSEAFSDMVQSIIKSLAKMVIQETITNPLSSALKSAMGLTTSTTQDTNNGTTSSSGLVSWFSSLLGFASGGPVQKDQPIRVGETGEELFVPSSNGTILSNSDLNGMGGGNTTHVTMNIYSNDVKGFQSSRKQVAAKMWDAVNMAQGIR